MQDELSNNSHESKFKGVMIDTGANRSKLMSLKQYIAFCREINTPLEIRKCSKSVAGLGGAQLVTVGKATIPIPFPDIGILCDITFRIHDDGKHLQFFHYVILPEQGLSPVSKTIGCT